MTIDELKNSDFVKMKKRVTKRHALYASIAAFLFICAVLYCLMPRTFDKNLFTNYNVSIVYAEPTIKYNSDKQISESDIKTKQFDFTRESPEFQQIEKVLGNYSYHICLRTFIDIGTSKNLTHSYMMWFGKSYLFISDIPYITVDNKTYRIGYWGNSKISKFDREIKDILKIK